MHGLLDSVDAVIKEYSNVDRKIKAIFFFDLPLVSKISARDHL